jgi:cytochrome c peroxidase
MTRMFIAAVLVAITGISAAAQRGRGFPPPPPDGGGRLNVPETNPLTPEKIAKGRELFFDTGLSADNSTSCATCHDPAKAFTDGTAVAIGIHKTKGARNTQTLVNAGASRIFFWDGRAGSLETQSLQPMMNAKEMGLKESQIEERTGMKREEVMNALASYMRTIRSTDSRVDYFRAGQTSMLSADEKAGFDLFRGRGGCLPCHSGPNFTDDRFHNTGVGFKNGVYSDAGRFDVTRDEQDRGAFKTPTLREIALTAPYMHDGSVATLEDVVEFYSNGGVHNPNIDPLVRTPRFSPVEKRQLVAFMKALTGRVTEGLPGSR